ncbi:hypothetical protein LTR10_014810 [Elasticomyces elasticus]|nr:hypothetical protein LTR10_014810 [Elasticomyces elasticus]
MAPDVILSSGLTLGIPRSQTFQTPKLQCTVSNLKRTCRQFRAMVNQLLHRTNSTTVVLVCGPVPNGGARESMKVAEQYKATLEKALAHALKKNQPHNVVVQFQPDVSAVYAWRRRNRARTVRVLNAWMEDFVAVIYAQRGHYAAAVMLAVIMKVIVGKNPRVRTRLVFHEQDGTSLYKECAMMVPGGPVCSKELPFWEVSAIRVILDHWRWLRNDEGNDEMDDKDNKKANVRPGSSIHQYVTLPQTVYAEANLNQDAVRERWSEQLQKAWLTDDKGPFPLSLQAPYAGRRNDWWDPYGFHWLPRRLYLPESGDVTVRCFLIKIVELGGMEDTKIEVMELQRPAGLTTSQIITNIVPHNRRQPTRQSSRLINSAERIHQ